MAVSRFYTGGLMSLIPRRQKLLMSQQWKVKNM